MRFELAAPNLMKSTITEQQQKNKTRANLENFFPRERVVDKNGWQHYVYQANENVHYMVPMFEQLGLERVVPE